jgi:hypothetical protein
LTRASAVWTADFAVDKTRLVPELACFVELLGALELTLISSPQGFAAGAKDLTQTYRGNKSSELADFLSINPFWGAQHVHSTGAAF